MQKVYHKPGSVTESALPLQPFSRTIILQTRLFIDVARSGLPERGLTGKGADRDPGELESAFEQNRGKRGKIWQPWTRKLSRLLWNNWASMRAKSHRAPRSWTIWARIRSIRSNW